MITLVSVIVLIVFAIWPLTKFLRSSPPEHSPFRIRFSDLGQWKGTVDRGAYALVGVVGFALKHNIDRIVATSFFGRKFTPLNYWIPPVTAIRVDQLSTSDARFLLTMITLALPFIWIGLAMTVRR